MSRAPRRIAQRRTRFVRGLACVVALALPGASVLAADPRYAPWPPAGAPRGEYRGDDVYRDSRGPSPRELEPPGASRGAYGYSPWERRGDRPWARLDGGRGEWRSDRPPDPPPVPAAPEYPASRYGYGRPGGGPDYPGTARDPWSRY